MEQIIIREAGSQDIDAVAAIYAKIHTAEENGDAVIGWKRGIYPEREHALAAFERGWLFVLEYGGTIAGAGIINNVQADAYSKGNWERSALPDRVMVLHTLVIDPELKGRGLGRCFVNFYEQYALYKNCPYLRMDTNEKNLAARRLYKSLGYVEAGIVPCVFNGLDGVNLLLLEKFLG